MKNHLKPKKVVVILLGFFIGYALFASITTPSSFDMRSRSPERWALWRYITTALWLVLIYVIYSLRNQQFYGRSFKYAVFSSGVVAFSTAIIWVSMTANISIMGSAAVYVLIAGLLCMSISNAVLAGSLAVILFIIQVAGDIVVLGLAGQFRLH